MNIIRFIKYKFRKKFYGNKKAEQLANKLLYLKVQSPFDRNQSVIMIDLLAATAMTEKQIWEIVRMYGIEVPSMANDISGNHALEYLLYHGEKYRYITYSNDGEKISHGLEEINGTYFATDVLPLLPNGHIEKMIDLFSYTSEGFNSFYGQAIEFNVKYKLQEIGYEVRMPVDRNVEGFDLAVEKQFFEDNNLMFSEHPDLPGYGVVQIKSTSSINETSNFIANTKKHFEKYEDIPVIASQKITDSLPPDIQNKAISFEGLGIDEQSVETTIFNQYEALRSFIGDHNLEKFNIQTGLDTTQFHDILENCRSAEISIFSDIGFQHIPTLGIAISTSISFIKNYRLWNEGEIDKLQAGKNLTYDVGKTLFIGSSTIMVGGAISTQFGLNLQESFNTSTESVKSVSESFFDGEGLDSLQEFDPDALYLLPIIIGYGLVSHVAKKSWNLLFSDPLENYKKLYSEKIMIADSITSYSTKKQHKIFEIIKPKEYNQYKKERKKCIREYKKILKAQYDIYPISYYVLRHKINCLDGILKHIGADYISVKESIERTKSLKEIEKDLETEENVNEHLFLNKLVELYDGIIKNAQEALQGMVSNAKKDKAYLPVIKSLIINEIDYQVSIYGEYYAELGSDDDFLQIKINEYNLCRKNIIIETKKLKDKGLL